VLLIPDPVQAIRCIILRKKIKIYKYPWIKTRISYKITWDFVDEPWVD